MAALTGRRILRALFNPNTLGTAEPSKVVTADANTNVTGLTLTNATLVTPTSGSISATTVRSTADPAPATTALVDIAGLTKTLTAGATYKFRCVLTGLADGTSGITYAFKYTTATLTSILYSSTTYTASAVASTNGTTTTDATLITDKAAAVVLTIIEGTMVVNAGGSVKLQAGLHTGTTAAAVSVGSTMTFDRIA